MKSTGPNSATRDLVRARAEDCCELCGRWAVAGQLHHRRPRSLGGSSNPEINLASNLTLFCFDCHDFVERTQRASAYRYGWLVPSGAAPREHPFLLWGSWVYFDDLGRYLPAPDPEPRETERELF